jgi:hypothetical protein
MNFEVMSENNVLVNINIQKCASALGNFVLLAS